VAIAKAEFHVHTQRFAFRALEEDDESVKMSNTTSRRASAHRAADDAPSIVILLALSESSEGPALGDCSEGTPAPSRPALPAAAGISPSFSMTSAFPCVLCVKSFALLSAASPQNRQFLFNTNEPLPNFATRTKQTTSPFPFAADKLVFRTSNLAIHTKQITSSQITTLFLFNTNERSLITTHQSPVTNATGALKDFHIRSGRGSMAAENLATKINTSGKGKA
jgi:hypothetical protein